MIEVDQEAAEDVQEVDESVHAPVILGYKIVGDNVDKNIKPRYYRQDRQTVSLHCYHSYAVQDRINIHGLSDETPDLRSTPLLSIPVNTVLPSQTDESNILHNITILVSRELVQHLKYFEDNFSDVTVKHY